MTTTINLNFLNFFRLKFNDNHTRINAELSEQNQNYSPGRERIIDVTPYSRAAYSEEKDNTQIETTSHSARLAIPHNVIARTYDRRGHSVEYTYQKGLHIDSYV